MFSFFARIKPASFFVFAAILFSALYTCLRPPMQSPDEFNHFLRAYQVSEGHFLPEKKDQRLGGEMPVCLGEFKSIYMPMTFIMDYKGSRKIFSEGFEVDFSDKERVFMDFPNTSYHSPVSYLPHAFALFVLRQLNCSVGWMYHGSKFFVFMIWLLSMFFVIKTIPVYKWLFTLLLLLPMSLYIANSYSADVITNILSLMLIALVLKTAFGENKVTRKDMAIILLMGVLLASTKIVYVGLLFLLFIIPSSRFSSRSNKYLSLGCVFFISCITAYLMSRVIMNYYLPFEEYNINYRAFATIHTGANYYKQKEHLMNHGLHFFKVIYNSIFGDTQFYLLSYIGRFGTYMDTPVPVWFFITSFITIIFVAFTELNKVTLSYVKKIFLFLAAIITYALLLLSQHLTWNNVGNDIVDSFQGRYLVPILPLIFMLFNNSWKRLKFNPALIVIIFVCLSNAYTCNMLYDRYFKERYLSKEEFSCNFEEVDKDGFFKTSDPKIKLRGGDHRSSTEHKRGKYSMTMAADSVNNFVYNFKDLRLGDLVEIYAWQKGDSGKIVIMGHGVYCQPYYFINNDVQLKDKNGWKKMQMIFSMFVECDSSDVYFYFKNPTRRPMYFDDLRFSVKKFRK
jgi:uncharacterized membrane protein